MTLGAANTLTDDAFLGGRLQILQPRQGFRAGIEAVLLAAATPAMPGERALELGTGVGTAALCLARRVTGLSVTAVERDSWLAHLARRNAARNTLDDRVRIIEADATAPLPDGLAGAYDHVFANPPFNDPRSTQALNPRRAGSLAAGDGAIGAWIATAAAALKEGGCLTMIFRADRLDALEAALNGPFGACEIVPLPPHAGRPAKRVLIRARTGKAGARFAHEGVVLHGATEKYAPAIEAVLRHGAGFPWPPAFS
ncbi:MAG: methyltransferase [Alphaproteobacteria bacterium]|nr:methyltransferase [Alphaproteobacteria bacterium]